MDHGSLAFTTDLFFPRFEGIVEDRDEYVMVRTPANPGFWWGNYLQFRRPPGAADFERWMRLWDEEFGGAGLGHRAFGIGGTEGDYGDLAAFLAAGFERDGGVVLTASWLPRPRRWNGDVAVRRLASDADWQAAIDLQVMCRESEFADEAPYRKYIEAKFRRYRAMAEAGRGAWFGAFEGGDLRGDLGIFVRAGLARYQAVETHPAARRRGIAATLLHAAAEFALRELGARRLVIVAEPMYHAVDLYRSMGFRDAEMQVGLVRVG